MYGCSSPSGLVVQSRDAEVGHAGIERGLHDLVTAGRSEEKT